MIEDFNELSPDLEWMLQSNQVDDSILIEVLVQDYYEPIFRLALDCLTYPEQAHRVTQDTFIIAISGERNLRGGMRVFDWLADIAKEICQERRAMIATQRLLNPRLIDSIRRRESSENLSPRQLEAAKKTIYDKVKSKKISGTQRARFKEILLLGSALLVAFFLMRYIDSAVSSLGSPTEHNQSVSMIQEVTDEFSLEPSTTQSPPTRLADSFPPQAPLSANSTHDEIWRRILISRYLWNSLWADVYIILYGPSDYIGPPRAERHQIWLDQEVGGLHLSGPSDGTPIRFERINATSKGPEPTSFLTGTADFSRIGSQVPWFYISSDMIMATPYMTNFFFIADYDFPPQRVWYTAVDELEWAGRKAVIVEMTDHAGKLISRIWLDAQTGIALREQYLGDNSQDKMLLEITVSKIKFEVKIPASLNNSTDKEILERGFTRDHMGQPESHASEPFSSPFQAVSSQAIPPIILPQNDFDPARSWLTFAVEESSFVQGKESVVYVFGDLYYLGSIALGDPFRTICDRAKDGSKIVISQWPDSPSDETSIISVFDLFELNQIKYIVPETYITRLAFSPGSRFIAVAGISPNEIRSDLYIIDTITEETELINGIEDIWSLAWNPDGTQLATMSWPSFRMYTQTTLHIGLYDLENGEATSYLRLSDFPWGMSNIEIPMEDWSAKFQLAMGGLEPCAPPPNPSP